MATEGFEKAERQLLAFDRGARSSLPRAAAAGAKVIKEEVKRRAPRDQGDLADSVEDEALEGGNGRAEHVVLVGEFYGVFQEYGTKKMAAQPFFRPAIDAKKQEAAETMRRHILGAIQAEMGG